MSKQVRVLSLLAAATAVFGLTSFSRASLTYDVQVVSVSGTGVSMTDAHDVSVTGTGGMVNFAVFAEFTGTPSNANEVLFQGRINVIASGAGPHGNLSNGANVSPLNQTGAGIGGNVDLNADGFLDYGNATANSTSSVVYEDISGDTQTADPTTGNVSYEVFAFSMPITSLGGGSTTVSATNNASNLNTSYKVDGTATNGAAGYNYINSVLTSGAAPEPASLGVLALGGLALIARRRKAR